jgi:amino acid adenylation domain-containing protein
MTLYSIVELFEENVSKFSKNVAIERGKDKFSYEELDDKINALASDLSKAGIEKGDFVVVLSIDSLEVILSMLAIWKIGGVFIPLNPLDAVMRLKLELTELMPRCILINAALVNKIELPFNEMASHVLFLNKNKEKQFVPSAYRRVPLAPDDLCYIYFTSGSTGKPKGIMGRYKAIRQFIEWEVRTFHLTEGLRGSQLITPIFDAFLRDVLVPLSVGGTLCIPEDSDLILDGDKLAGWLEIQCINLMHCGPSLFRSMLRNNLTGRDFSHLKYILLSGEPLLPADVKKWVEQVRDHVQLVNLYGASETTMVKFFYLVQPQDQNRSSISIGKPIQGATALVVNERGGICSIGEIGEIYVRTPYRSLGYYNQPELTQQVFIPNPFSSDMKDLVYKTGDFGRLLETGDFECLGRKDQQVKIRGIRIELDEINNLLRQHPSVVDVAVIDVRDSQGNNYLCAYIVSNKQTNTDELSQYLSQLLPDYMVPSAFIMMESLPRGMTGKLDRRSLPKPDYTPSQIGHTHALPRTPLEEILVTIWAGVLGLKTIGIHDNFFQIGGHSLLATQLMTRVREKLRLELPLRILFRASTVALFSKEILNIKEEEEKIPPIKRTHRPKKVPLSFAQERLWFLDQLEGSSSQYNIAVAVRLEGELKCMELESAFQKLILRHEALRTRFVVDDGIPYQTIEETVSFLCETIDLSEFADSEERAFNLAREEAKCRFDLAEAPLLRAKLFYLKPKVYLFVVTIHHMITDGWSMEILVKDLASLYKAELKHQEVFLQPLTIQYADFSLWQRQWLQGEVLEKKIRYWKETLMGHSGVLELSMDHKRPPLQSFRGGEVRFKISKSVKTQMEALNHKESATLFMSLMSSFSILLEQWSGSQDILIGFPIANRGQAEIEQLIGFFANTLVLRVKPERQMTFRVLLNMVRDSVLDAYNNQHLPFEKVVEELKLERHLNRNPLFQVMLILQNQRTKLGTLFDEMQVTPIEIDVQQAKFDLTCKILETAEDLEGILEFNASLFNKETVERMAKQLETIVERTSFHPDKALLDLDLLPTLERECLLVEWNATGKDYPQMTVCELFEQQVKRFPMETALIFGNEQISYAELSRRSNEIAHQLRSLGSEVESLVGIYLERSSFMVIAMLGVLKAGAAYIPLDPSYPQERISWMLHHSKAKFLITQKICKEKINTFDGEVIDIGEPFLPVNEVYLEENIGNLDRLAYVIYTSGSTGQPKGVQISHHSLANLLFSMEEIDFNGRMLALTTFSFDIAGLEIYLPLIRGKQVEIVPHDIARNGYALQEKLFSSQSTIMQATPATWRMLLSTGWRGEGVTHILCGGEQLTNELALELVGTGKEVWNLYGPTETTIWSMSKKITKESSTNLGRPITNTEIYILDSDFQPVPLGVSGEIHIGGNGVARGYLHSPDLTAERFIPNPFNKVVGARLYKTGDFGRYLPDGTIDFLGRGDQQIKMRGFRIELGEIEAVLRKHPQIQDAVVIVSYSHFVEGVLEAFVVTDGRGLDMHQIHTFLSQTLPLYMIPSTFVNLEKFPLTPNGKVDRRALQQSASPLIPFSEKFAPPTTPLEEALVEIWSQLLQREKIGIHENFFEIGGHSLLATQLVSRIENQLNIKIPLTIIFQTPTISGLAFHLRLIGQIEKAIEGQDSRSLGEQEVILF